MLTINEQYNNLDIKTSKSLFIGIHFKESKM